MNNKGNLIMLVGFLLVGICLLLDKGLHLFKSDTMILICYGVSVVVLLVGFIMNKIGK